MNYIIINKDTLEKRIKEIEEYEGPAFSEELKQILSQSTPLIPEIEKAFDGGSRNNQFPFSCLNKQDYISNLKLDI